ncbi:MAG: TlpA family protein disulfide reductase [Dokdonella sp.]|uniref:TlpA disulfide reductase family protein n=1 Tax=Dokdonella sp. TaxID=2291710 RepID=UPI0025C575DD|nr:TlpA disulfide reductase family protein [Dokdonella sp.]MBX3700600.1 TlpA family protein disulfide reductase [Dokdonella sp.]MCW5577610.1 TlpA family protein disulfide reductase [Dokdonella sp.]
MSSFGPFSTATVAVLIGVVIAWRLPYHLPRDASRQQRQQTAGHVFDALLFGLVAARLGFVLRWWPDYLAAPRALLALADGGYCAWLGIAAACAFVLWRTRRQQPLRRPALLAIALGSGAWLAAQGGFDLLAPAPPALPELALHTLDGQPVTPTQQRGRPVVLNLWATWCPPCRREMPALAQAAPNHPQVAFLFVNEGEDAATVRGYLEHEQLAIEHVLLDPQMQAMRALGARALPSTLFFDAQGRLVDSHLGELSGAGLKRILRRHFPPVAEPAAPH